jgi:hypothetical protein
MLFGPRLQTYPRLDDIVTGVRGEFRVVNWRRRRRRDCRGGWPSKSAPCQIGVVGRRFAST